MIELFQNKNNNLDSFEKMTLDFFRVFSVDVLSRVDSRDLDEVSVDFVRLVAPYLSQKAHNFQVCPFGLRDEYLKIEAPEAISTQLRAKSGRVYLVGFALKN